MNQTEKNVLRLESIIEGSNLGTWEWNIQTGETVFNEIWAQIIGYTLDELSPISIKTWENLSHPDDLKKSVQLLNRHFKGELPNYNIECRIKHKDGHWVWVRDRGKVTSWTADGKALMMYGSHIDISERKAAEEELRKIDEDLKESQRIAHVGSWRLDIATNEVKWSEELYKMYGFDSSMPPPNLNEHDKIFTPESWQRLSKALAETIETGIPYELELETVLHDGSNGWMWVRGEVLLDEKGATVGLRGAVYDITESKKTNAILQESEQKYSSLFNSMLEGFALHEIICDENGKPVDYRFLDMNPAFEKLTGLKKIDVVGKTVLDILPATESIWIEKYGNVALTGEPISFDNYSSALGQHYQVIAFCPKKNQFAVMFSDITQRKHAEETIAAEKERLAVTLRSIGDGVITTDIQGNVVIMNKVAEELCGWKQEKAVGKSLSEVFNIINESTRSPHENPVEKVLASGEIVELANHTLLISKDGTERIIEDSGAPIKDKESKTIGVVLVFRDTTEKHRMMDNMQRIDKLDSLGILAGGIAHDFNNLMGGVFGYIDLAREEPDRIIAKSYLSTAMDTINRARALTGQLLTFAKGGDPVQKLDNLFPFVEKTAIFALSGANVSCKFNVPKGLWACKFDKNQIGQVIDNLIINAQQAMPIGGTIELTAENITLGEKEHPNLPQGDFVKISVKDYGIGLSRELLPKIFDPFFTTKTKGHGLGLATCYSIINRHGGCIDVESELGKGSTFQVYLPASTETVSSNDKQKTKMHKGSGTFLVMDDEEVMQETISKMLKSFGYTVECRLDGQSAIDFFISEIEANRQIAGMIFDLTVPGGMGGKAAIEEIRKLNINVPVFVASGYAVDPVMTNPSKYGFTSSICKPFIKSELSKMLNKFMT